MNYPEFTDYSDETLHEIAASQPETWRQSEYLRLYPLVSTSVATEEELIDYADTCQYLVRFSARRSAAIAVLDARKRAK